MNKKITIFVSSLTGNTEKIATAIYNHLNELNYSVSIQDSCILNTKPISADLFILCFWCRRACVDDATKKLSANFSNTSFLAIGT